MAFGYFFYLFLLRLIVFDKILRGVAGTEKMKVEVSLQCKNQSISASGSAQYPLQTVGTANNVKNLGTDFSVVSLKEDGSSENCDNIQEIFASVSSNSAAESQGSENFLVFIGESACQGNRTKMYRIEKLIKYVETSVPDPVSLKPRVWVALKCDSECQTEQGFSKIFYGI